MSGEQRTRPSASVVWHDVECGGYAADLGLWEELAAGVEGPILDLGCGTGRVALRLARLGHEVLGLDRDAELLAAAQERGAGLPLTTAHADATAFYLRGELGLVLGPMQLIQMLSGEAERVACLTCVGRHLRPGARAAFAIVDGMPPELVEEVPPYLPDTRELDGWVYSSLPLDAGLDGETIVVRRLRQTVSPAGELDEEVDEVPLRLLSAATVEAEAREAGLLPAGRLAVPATDDHVGSVVLLFERAA